MFDPVDSRQSFPRLEEEILELRASAEHLAKLRDEVIEIGVLPPLDAWAEINPNL